VGRTRIQACRWPRHSDGDVLNKRSSDIKTLIHEFKYPPWPGQMWEAAATAHRTRHDVHMKHYVEGIELDVTRDRVRARTENGIEPSTRPRHLDMPIRSLYGAVAGSPLAVREAAEACAIATSWLSR